MAVPDDTTSDTPQPPAAGSSPPPDYTTWSQSSLISRITELERQLNSTNSPSRGRTASASRTPNSTSSSPSRPRTPKKSRPIDPSKYNTRFIALKFAYLGQRYNGYEHTSGNITPLPTIEEELWKALRKARLIFPPVSEGDGEGVEMGMGMNGERVHNIDWTGCEYSKCGRTDRGVSAFGQVVGIRVRSARPKKVNKVVEDEGLMATATAGNGEEAASATTGVYESGVENPLGGLSLSGSEESEGEDSWDDIADELPYITILNRVLPEDIRVLAWCPNPPPNFNARFSCGERRYRYFFTQPAFSPTPGPLGFLGTHGGSAPLREGWLDIEAMREGAKYLLGAHDFRNFCKVDPSKQITNHVRHIYHADIEEIDPKTKPLAYLGLPEFRALETENGEPTDNEFASDSSSSKMKIYTFTLHGSAFLWHQVRHLVAILFLVGQRLEPPSIVRDLLDVEKNARRPTYEMASDAPLVLWDCIFPDESSGSREDALNWVYAGDPRMVKTGKADLSRFGTGGTVDNLWRVWRQRKIDEVLACELLDLAVSQGDRSTLSRRDPKNPTLDLASRSQKMFYGGNEGKYGGKYVPLTQRKRLEPVEVINARYLLKKPEKARFFPARGESVAVSGSES
ncbi:tRNA pseudouridine(38-40) synthase [Helicocarpus griseus UAMH5409]|uniref:tRNA pseudouridine(38-40) synthase n=1 Tax=Helicocarpus griseus UAMH5409 TaxID=1447875 RepID=A0A2B7XTP7_9EURO|nr:tRNA pseudouridine(38-40) synthase [Helicocarpus griseus UAMH5409]